MSGDFVRTNELVVRAKLEYAEANVSWPDVELDLALADARTLFREQSYDAAIPVLRRLFRRAKTQHLDDTATVAALLLGCALADRHRLEEASRVFADVIADCLARGDSFHLTAAYANRTWLWSALGDIEQTERELERVIQVAREGGLAVLERTATHNLAEHRLWLGYREDALLLAKRSLALQTTAGEGGTQSDRLLVARALAGAGKLGELGQVVATFTSDDGVTPEEAITLAVLRAVVLGSQDALIDAAARLDQVPFVQLRLELGALAIARGAVREPMRQRLVDAAKVDPVWKSRLDELEPPKGS
jgi:tetratricopeptide (TPR) repeat protein